MQPLVFWVEMGGRLGGEMPNNRAFGPRNVMNNRGVVRTRVRSGISMIVSATVLVQKEGKMLSCTFLGKLQYCPGFVCLFCWCRKTGGW